jgi:hypothetical protein
MVMGRPTFAYDVKGVRDVPFAILTPDESPASLAALIRTNSPIPPIEQAGLEAFRTPAVAAWLLDHLETVVG